MKECTVFFLPVFPGRKRWYGKILPWIRVSAPLFSSTGLMENLWGWTGLISNSGRGGGVDRINGEFLG